MAVGDLQLHLYFLLNLMQILDCVFINLFSDDFDLNPNYPLPDGMSKYLFDSTPHMAGRTNDYLHAVNVIYQVK